MKHLFGFLALLFAIDFSVDDSVTHPNVILKNAFIIYVMFLILSKANFMFTLITFGLLLIIYYLQTLIIYHKKTDNNLENIEKYVKYSSILNSLIVLNILIGFSFYFVKQRSEHKNWSTLKFIFGTTKCKST